MTTCDRLHAPWPAIFTIEAMLLIYYLYYVLYWNTILMSAALNVLITWCGCLQPLMFKCHYLHQHHLWGYVWLLVCLSTYSIYRFLKNHENFEYELVWQPYTNYVFLLLATVTAWFYRSLRTFNRIFSLTYLNICFINNFKNLLASNLYRLATLCRSSFGYGWNLDSCSWFICLCV